MDFKIYLHTIIGLSVIVPALSSCLLRDTNYSDCTYTVFCDGNPTGVSNPSCSRDPFVTFIITNSRMDYLTTAYFSATNFDQRVKVLKVVNASWTSIETAAFKYYTKCLNMDLSNNNIVHIKNEAFIQLVYLRTLNLSSNSIQRLSPKSFYISSNKNTELENLDLSNNMLTELSTELNELPKLKNLLLQNNKLTHIAEDAFVSLKNLNYLFMKNNCLPSLNLTLTNLKMVKQVDVSYNNLTQLVGFEINRLIAIEYFNASHNSLQSVESNCFNQAFSLQKVDFSFNNISTPIEHVMFINTNGLKYLNFYSNKITGIQDNSFKHCSLEYLNLDKNNLTGEINENTFDGLNNITKMDFSRQHITTIRNKAFAKMDNLTSLNLSMNSIKDIDNSSFVNSSISILDLSFNKISHIFFFENALSNLIELYLNNNNIEVILRNLFINQKLIKILDLSMNRIIHIEDNSLPLQSLQYFNITGNRLGDVVKKNVFSPAKFLRFLDLSNQNITKIEESAFTDLSVLARLNLSNNYIESIDPNNFKGVDNMFSLDISNNNLTTIQFNDNIFRNLKALYINNNKLANITGLFPYECKLLYLDLTGNTIENVTEIGANILPNITVLRLDNNKIKKFNNPHTSSLTTLIDLSVASNEISEIKLHYYKELISLDLRNNSITFINSSSFQDNQHLQALDISKNKISDVPPGTFRYMKNLKLLNLSSNYLTTLRYGSLKGLHKTEVLDLSKNNIITLDVDVFHECNELKTLIIDYNQIKSFDVERLIVMSLRKLKTLSLGGNPIACREIIQNIKSTNVTFYAIRQVEVTSIDKIYHEDNVHGIRCGDDVSTSSNTTEGSILPTSSDSDYNKSTHVSSMTVVLIWCTVLTILVLILGVIYFSFFHKGRVLIMNSNMSFPTRNSLELDGSEFQSDLLG